MLKIILKKWKNELKNIYSEKEIESIFFIFINEKYNISKIDFLIERYDSKIAESLDDILEELKKEKPIQYILGKTKFMDKTFFLDENTLIPRPETQELISWIIDENKHKRDIKILDIGTGSGIIAIILALSLDAEVWAIDISKKALDKAIENSKKLGVKINFQNKDILNDEIEGKYDIIVSNPPYVLESEKLFMKKNVLDYEPFSALFVEDKNPLIFYDKISLKSKKKLTKNGTLYFEINEKFSSDIIKVLKKYEYKNIEIRKDFFLKDRMIRAFNYL